MSIARRTEKKAKVREDLNILRAVPVLLIKVLTDLEKLRVAFFYRHLGPSGPEETCRCIQNLAPSPNRSYPAHPGNPASDAREIKGLTALEKRRSAFFYRHIGPYGPKETCHSTKGSSSCSSCSSWPSCFRQQKTGCNFGQSVVDFNVGGDVPLCLTDIRKTIGGHFNAENHP